jgi:hypothetical protein
VGKLEDETAFAPASKPGWLETADKFRSGPDVQVQPLHALLLNLAPQLIAQGEEATGSNRVFPPTARRHPQGKLRLMRSHTIES